MVGAVVPSLSRVLPGDFVEFVQRKMRDEYYPNTVVKGRLPAENKVGPFLVMFNDLDVTNEYLKRVVGGWLRV